MPNYLSYCGQSIQLSDDPAEARKERDIVLNEGLEALKKYRAQTVEALEPIVEEVKVETVANEEVNNKKSKKNKKGGK